MKRVLLAVGIGVGVTLGWRLFLPRIFYLFDVTVMRFMILEISLILLASAWCASITGWITRKRGWLYGGLVGLLVAVIYQSGYFGSLVMRARQYAELRDLLTVIKPDLAIETLYIVLAVFMGWLGSGLYKLTHKTK